MVFIKKLCIEGFKSFGRKTEINFDKGLNVIVGPNGSGKSNIIDAICFVLGRLAMKSLRADKSRSLIFKGSKETSGADIASVKLTFDNSSGKFVIDNNNPKEVFVERVLKSDGSSIYRINGKAKTRNELLELLNQVNISPYGFNLIQQQEIFKFVDMGSEERRRLIEEIAGISIYESRKEKAMKEFEKTEEKIKEIKAILSEKQNFLKNLDNERKQALLYNQIKQSLESLKFSIIERRKDEKLEEKKKMLNDLSKQDREKNDKEEKQKKLQNEIEAYRKEIASIDMHIENISGVEQTSLQNSIMELKTQLARLDIKKNMLTGQISGADEKIKKLDEEIKANVKELSELRERQKEKLDRNEGQKISDIDKKIEEARKRLDYLNKRIETIEANSRELILAKERLNFMNKNYLALTEEIEKRKENLIELKTKVMQVEPDVEGKLKKLEKKIEENNKLIKEREKIANGYEKEQELAKIELNEIQQLDICPKCKRQLDEDYKKKLEYELKSKIKDIDLKRSGLLNEVNKINEENNSLLLQVKAYEKEKENIKENKIIEQKIKDLRKSLEESLKRKKELETRTEELNKIIPELEASINARELIEEELFSIREKLNGYLLDKEKIKNKIVVNEKAYLDIEIKEREIENEKSVLARTEKEKEKAQESLKAIETELVEISKLLKEKQEKYEEVYKKFSNLIEKKNLLHEKIVKSESELSSLRSESFLALNKINELNVNIARVDAELKVIEDESQEFNGKDIKIIKLPLDRLEEKLQRAKFKLEEIGNVNMLALETYEQIRKEVSEVEEKLNKIDQEKQEIIKQIERINKEKRRVFISTFEKINQEFSNNFNNLSEKGTAKLILENEKEPFESGIDIVIQFAKGKYLSSSSLSGGEKVLVALAFIFAIQNLSPYHFYVFDEIDAALDKRNSERLAGLLKRHIGNHQCIIISHNDATISHADLIYGISMQDGTSKVISLKL